MRRIYAYIISSLTVILFSPLHLNGQDTIMVPLKVNAGIEAMGPVNYLIDKNILNMEGYVSVDLNEKYSAVLAGGYLDYRYSQYNYTYLNNGYFVRAGVDINLLKPKKSLGKYWGGLGLRYGLSRFNWEVPGFSQNNYWGEASSSIPHDRSGAHFIEASPGMRAEIFRNFSMGWSVSLRMLLHTGTDKDLRPIYIPGFGNGEKRFSTGFSYFIVWNIPFKKIRIIIPKEEPEEEEEYEDTGTNTGSGNSGSSGFGQEPRGSGFR